MSKTFKSAGNPCASISITPSADGVRTVHVHGIEASGVTVSTADAPALALAILEAAGVVPENRVFREGSDGHLQCIAYDLTRYLDKSAERAAEAREQAELEAEALELFRAFQHVRTDGVFASIPSFASLSEPHQAEWLAVVRKAREIGGRAEK